MPPQIRINQSSTLAFTATLYLGVGPKRVVAPLTQVTGVTVTLTAADDSVLVDGEAGNIVGSPAAGRVGYKRTTGPAAVPGPYTVKLVATYTDGSSKTFPEDGVSSIVWIAA